MEHAVSCVKKEYRWEITGLYRCVKQIIENTGMDGANMRNMERIVHGDPKHKLYLLLDFTSRPGAIADPWYTGNFDATFTDVMEGCSGLLKYLKSQWTDEKY